MQVVLVVVFMAAALMAAVADIVDRTHAGRGYREFKNGEEYYAAQDFDFCST